MFCFSHKKLILFSLILLKTSHCEIPTTTEFDKAFLDDPQMSAPLPPVITGKMTKEPTIRNADAPKEQIPTQLFPIKAKDTKINLEESPATPVTIGENKEISYWGVSRDTDGKIVKDANGNPVMVERKVDLSKQNIQAFMDAMSQDNKEAEELRKQVLQTYKDIASQKDSELKTLQEDPHNKKVKGTILSINDFALIMTFSSLAFIAGVGAIFYFMLKPIYLDSDKASQAQLKKLKDVLNKIYDYTNDRSDEELADINIQKSSNLHPENITRIIDVLQNNYESDETASKERLSVVLYLKKILQAEIENKPALMELDEFKSFLTETKKIMNNPVRKFVANDSLDQGRAPQKFTEKVEGQKIIDIENSMADAFEQEKQIMQDEHDRKIQELSDEKDDEIIRLNDELQKRLLQQPEQDDYRPREVEMQKISPQQDFRKTTSSNRSRTTINQPQRNRSISSDAGSSGSNTPKVMSYGRTRKYSQ